MTTRAMIKVIRGREMTGTKDGPARWHYSVEGYGLSGLSRQPLSDACRQLIAQGVDPETPVGRFREGRDEPDITSTVGIAASLTVSDPDKRCIHFAPFQPWHRREAYPEDSYSASGTVGRGMEGMMPEPAPAAEVR